MHADRNARRYSISSVQGETPLQTKVRRRLSAPASPSALRDVQRSSSFTRNTRFLTAHNLSHLEALGLPDLNHPILSPLVPSALRFAAAQNVIRDFLSADGANRSPPPPPVPPPPVPYTVPPPPDPPARVPMRSPASRRMNTIRPPTPHTKSLNTALRSLSELRVALTPTSFTMSPTDSDNDSLEYSSQNADSLSDMADETVEEPPHSTSRYRRLADNNPTTPTTATTTLERFESVSESPGEQFLHTEHFGKFRALSPPRKPLCRDFANLSEPFRPVPCKISTPSLPTRHYSPSASTRVRDLRSVESYQGNMSYMSNQHHVPKTPASVSSRQLANTRPLCLEPAVESITTSSSGFSNGECVPSHPGAHNGEALSTTSRRTIPSDTSNHTRAFSSPMSILPTFPSTSSRSVTAHSFLVGPTHPGRDEEYPVERSHRRRDSHHAFIHSLEEPILREPSPFSYNHLKIPELGEASPPEVRKTKSVFHKRISQARDASVGIVAVAKKLPRAASMSRFKFSLERDRTGYSPRRKESPKAPVSPQSFERGVPSDETDYTDTPPVHDEVPVATVIKSATPLETRVPNSPDVIDEDEENDSTPSTSIRSPEISVGAVSSAPAETEVSQSPCDSTQVPEAVPDFVTIRRVIRRIKMDGSEEIVSTRVRMRPEAVLPNGDVVVKRVMKREKEDGSGLETLTVCQVIPRKTPPRNESSQITSHRHTMNDGKAVVSGAEQASRAGALEPQKSVGERTVSLPSTLMDCAVDGRSKSRRSHSFGAMDLTTRRRTSVRLPGGSKEVGVEELPHESVGENQRMARRNFGLGREKEPTMRRVKSAKMRRTFSGHARREGEAVGSKSHSPRMAFWTRTGKERTSGKKGAIKRVLSFGSLGGAEEQVEVAEDEEQQAQASSPIRRLRGVLRAWRGEV